MERAATDGRDSVVQFAMMVESLAPNPVNSHESCAGGYA